MPPRALPLACAALAPASAASPARAANITVYAIRPLALVDITDKDSANAAGDIFFWMKDHIVKPMHCRADPSFPLCSDTGVIDHDLVYQTFVVEYDTSELNAYADCNPDKSDPSGATWKCVCRGSRGKKCSGIGEEPIAGMDRPMFPGDPSPLLADKFASGVWVSTMHDTECGNPGADQSLPCTWRKIPGKIVSAECLNGNLISIAAGASGGAVAACEASQGSKCDYLNAAATGLSDCCARAFIAGVNATPAAAFTAPFAAAFASDDPSEGGCEAVAPPAP